MSQENQTHLEGKRIIVTGWRKAGKTTFCKALVASARQSGCQVAGVLSHAIFENRQKTAIEVEDLRSGQRRILARNQPHADNQDTALNLGAWNFDETALRWGNDVLARAVPCQLLLVDELGPLELMRGEGWTAGLAALDSGAYRMALVVIRPELLEAGLRRWKPEKIIEIEPGFDLQACLIEMKEAYPGIV